MLKGLERAEQGLPIGTDAKSFQALVSRGWVQRRDGGITAAGLKYLKEHPKK